MQRASPAGDDLDAAVGTLMSGPALLRSELGFTGVTITNSLDGTAHARSISTRRLAAAAAPGPT